MRIKYYLIIGFLFCVNIIQAQLTQYEYWFNNDFAGRITQNIGGSETIITDMDVRHLPDGFHRWHLRVKNSDGSYSGITSGDFVKQPAVSQTKLEYWYNDDYAGKKEIAPGSLNDFSMESDIDVRDMPWGVNRFNLRLSNGAISSSYVLKTVASASNKLEYWFNDEYADRKRINSDVYGDVVTIGSMVDVSHLADGIHQIHYRVVSNVTGHSPVISDFFLKADRNLTASPADKTYEVTTAKVWIDDNKANAIFTEIEKPAEEITFTKTYDAANLSTGKHTVNVQFMNSAGSWSVAESLDFTKMEYEKGITLTSSVENGVVNLSWNSSPNVAKYEVKRGNSSVTTEEHKVHPFDFSITDVMAAGTYTYQVYGYEKNGSQIYTSNKETVVVATAAENKNAGTLLVYVQDVDGNFIDGVDIQYTHSAWEGVVTDKYTTSSSLAKISVPYRMFAGSYFGDTSGNVTAAKEGYVIELAAGSKGSYKLDRDIPSTTVRFVATPVVEVPNTMRDIEMASSAKDNIYYDIDGYYDYAKTTFTVTLRNVSGVTWSGCIYMKVSGAEAQSSSNYLVSFDDIPRVEVSGWEPARMNWLGTSLTGGERTFELDFSRYRNKFPNGNFTVTFYSQQKMGNVYISQKAVGYTDKYSNPTIIVANKDQEPIIASNYDIVNEMVNDMFLELNKKQSFYKNLSTKAGTLQSVNDFIGDTYELNDPIISGLLSNATTYFNGVYKNLGRIIEAKEQLQEYIELMNFLKNPQSFIDGYEKIDFASRDFFYLCKFFTEKVGGSFYAQIFKPYFEVGTAMAEKIHEIDAFIFNNYDIYDFGNPSGKTVKIKVDGFNAEQIKRQIASVEVWAGEPSNMNFKATVSELPVDTDKDAYCWFALFSGVAPSSVRIKITFNNGRIMWVPVNSDTTKETISKTGVIVRLKSVYKLEKHMADKIYINTPRSLPEN